MSLKDELKQNTEQSYANKDGGFGPSTFKVPDGVEMFQAKKGTNKIDIIPFRNKEGKAVHFFEFYRHTGVGVNNAMVICPNKTEDKGKPCPICEERTKLKAAGHAWDSDEMKAVSPKRRVIYNVIDHAEPEKGIKLFETSQYSFSKKLLEEAWVEDEDGEKTDEMLIFADLEDGKTISFKGREKVFNGRTSISEFDSFVFLDRKKPYSEKMLSKAHPLDTLLITKTYKELQDMWLGAPEEDEDDEPTPVKAKPVDDDDDDDVPFAGKTMVADDDDDESEAKPRKKKVEAVAQECPEGNVFGKHFDKYEECDDCPQEFRKPCQKASS
jgi:hypothetical protein